MFSVINKSAHSRTLRAFGVSLGCASLLLLAACGESGSTDSSATGSDSLIGGGGSQVPASEVSTSDLQINAANNAAKGLRVNVGSMQRLASESPAVGSGVNLAQSSSDDGPFSDDPNATLPAIFEDDIGGDFTSVVNASLGLTGNDATTTRDGTRLTIDPDDAAVCQRQLLGLDAAADDIQLCQQLVADLIVQIDASTEDTGLVTYLFQGEVVLLIGYSPTEANYELKLAGLKTLALRIEELQPGSVDDIPDVMQGAVRISARVINESIGLEAGSFALAVTEQLRIVDNSDGTSIDLAPSTLLTVDSDSAAGAASIVLDVGALSLSFPDEDDFGNSSVGRLVMSGLTGRFDLTEDGNEFRVSNLGLRQGPLTISIDSVEAVRLTMETLGFTANADTSTISIDTALSINLMVNNVMGMMDASDSNLSLMLGLLAPAGTGLLGQDNGSLMVTRGGPLDIIIDLINGPDVINDSISIPAGQCLGADDSGAGLIAAVSC